MRNIPHPISPRNIPYPISGHSQLLELTEGFTGPRSKAKLDTQNPETLLRNEGVHLGFPFFLGFSPSNRPF